MNKLITLLATIALALSVSACGGGGGSYTEGDGSYNEAYAFCKAGFDHGLAPGYSKDEIEKGLEECARGVQEGR